MSGLPTCANARRAKSKSNKVMMNSGARLMCVLSANRAQPTTAPHADPDRGTRDQQRCAQRRTKLEGPCLYRAKQPAKRVRSFRDEVAEIVRPEEPVTGARRLQKRCEGPFRCDQCGDK